MTTDSSKSNNNPAVMEQSVEPDTSLEYPFVTSATANARVASNNGSSTSSSIKSTDVNTDTLSESVKRQQKARKLEALSLQVNPNPRTKGGWRKIVGIFENDTALKEIAEEVAEESRTIRKARRNA